jgi:hypothetical protein
VGDGPIDIVAKGFDAGIGSQDHAAADMIAVRAMAPTKVAIVGAPAYFARRRPPRTVDDLARHSCVQYRQTVDGHVVGWPLLLNGKTRRISVDGQVMVNDAHLATRAAVDGLGIALTTEALAEPFLRSGQLIRVLKDWSPSFEGFFVYYPGHRQVPATLRALIDMIRAGRGSAPARRPLQNPFTKGLSESKLRQKSALCDLKTADSHCNWRARWLRSPSYALIFGRVRSMSTTAIDFTPNNSSPRSTACVVAGARALRERSPPAGTL